MKLELDLRLPIGARVVPVRLTSIAPSIAIVGPSGVGKTSLLRAIAGLGPCEGRIVVDDRVLRDDAQKIALPPHQRQVGYVPQDALLFPHLSVQQNVAFAARAPVDPIARALGIERLLERSPSTLSGGERQRVAIVRALACAPRTLLLDEPLVALDRAARTQIARAITEHCAEHAILRIVVAHDESDLSALTEARFEMTEAGIADST